MGDRRATAHRSDRRPAARLLMNEIPLSVITNPFQEASMREKLEYSVPSGIRQESDGWHVAVGADGEVHVFATRDEAIAYRIFTIAITDGATAAWAETQRGDVAQVAECAPPTAKKPEPDTTESYP